MDSIVEQCLDGRIAAEGHPLRAWFFALISHLTAPLVEKTLYLAPQLMNLPSDAIRDRIGKFGERTRVLIPPFLGNARCRKLNAPTATGKEKLSGFTKVTTLATVVVFKLSRLKRIFM